LFDRIYGISQDLTYWEANNPMTLAKDSKKLNGLKLYFDCGTSDESLEDNREFHHLLDSLGVAHTYHEVPGTHENFIEEPNVPALARQLRLCLDLATGAS